MDAGSFAKWMSQEWATVSHAPLIFLACLIVAGLMIWRVVHWQYSTQLAHAQSALSLRDAQVQDYKEKLSGATPDEAKARLDILEEKLNKLSPRRISDSQKSAIVSAIRPFKGCQVNLVKDGAAPGMERFVRVVTSAFVDAGWSVNPGMVIGIANPPNCGVRLVVQSPADLTSPQQGIAAGLRGAGIHFELQAGRARGNPPADAELLFTSRIED